MFYCQPQGPCKHVYPSSRARDIHQRTCPDFNADDEDLDVELERLKRQRMDAEEQAAVVAVMGPVQIDSAPLPDPPATSFDDVPLPPDDQMVVDDLPLPRDPTPPVETSGRPVRTKRPTWKILQQLPEPPAPLPDVPDAEPEDQPPAATPAPDWTIRTSPNNFGLYREYPCIPTHNPDTDIVLTDLCDIPAPSQPNRPSAGEARLSPLAAPTEILAAASESNAYAPFGNFTRWGFMNWMWTGSATKSLGEGVRLLDYLKSPLFKLADLVSFDLKAETLRFDQFLRGKTSNLTDGWQQTSVKIDVLDHRRRTDSEPLLQYTVHGLHFRDLTETIKAALVDASAKAFHYTPFRQFWVPKEGGDPQRVLDEIFSSDAYIDEHNKLQSQPPEPGCTLERCVIALMLWSDATHLANFGTASLWPIYLFFGNCSKWLRGKPRARACHHIAYMPKLPDDFFDWFRSETGEAPRPEVIAHCRRELLHAIWKLLLDGKFMEACKHGIVVECPDGISRRFYPRFFTYSADYPEKVLLAAIRGLGRCPCPRCTIPAVQFHELGTVNDNNRRVKLARAPTTKYQNMVARARRFIYRAKKVIKSKAVEGLMQPESWVPTQSAFLKIEPFTWDMYRMLAPDLMHEFELGVWKGTFTHLLRILYAHGGDAITDLNLRYRLMPTFARDTIRRFTNNTSGMKKLAARDFEDILQCSMPVFEHLLDNDEYAADNEMIQDLLFAHAYWHGLAKLRMHTAFTLECLKDATRDLGYQLRRFARTTCKTFVTKELPREEAARRKRYTRKVAEAGQTGAPPPPETSATTKVKTFNGNTVKTHFLGDYVPTIPLIGTSDSWSTATGELEHKRSKAFYSRTSKNQATTQISNLERREAVLAKIGDRVRAAAQAEDAGPAVGEKRKRPAARGGPSKQGATLSFAQTEALPYTAPEEHVHVSFSRNVHVPLDVWIRQHIGDPAFNNFRVKLDRHLLGRILHPEYSTDGSEYTTSDRNHILIVNDRIYIHKVIRINYTDYTVRRGQDSMNPRTHADVMTLAPEGVDGHPFSYYRIVGVWHCDVQYREFGYPTPKKTICLLYARRFRLDKTFKGGFKRRRLHRIELVPEMDDDAYVFLNPDEIIRESHVVPAYAHGALPRVFHETIGRKAGEFNDWKYYYVNFFVDRDMLMRYLGGGVGHSYRVIVPDPPQEPAEEPEDESEDEPTEIDPAAAHLVPDTSMGLLLPEDSSENEEDGELDEEDDEDGAGAESEGDDCSESDLDDSDELEAAAGQDEGDEGFYLGPEDGEDGLDDGLRDLASGVLE
uniref:Uncharacterized protein n=1 Tax=Mycena chlorophos TaxID=658473 RepID=A0ABQ0LUA8_MYCCL|nr:predicted protein [Mycena chlorophos]